jgi:hypothetical protein
MPVELFGFAAEVHAPELVDLRLQTLELRKRLATAILDG